MPLKFREEDYFILVPVEEACKVLGLPCRLQVDQKTKKPIGVYVGEYVEKKRPLLVIQEVLRRGGVITSPVYEENGIVWVPFYWLAEQAGIRWWEVRNGKIYVAPKQGTK